MFISPAYAQDSDSSGMILQFLPIVLIFVVFYFLLIRPQQKKQKEHQKLVADLKTGDKVITSGGMHGMVANIKETTILLKVADNVKVELDRAAVSTIVKPTEAS